MGFGPGSWNRAHGSIKEREAKLLESLGQCHASLLEVHATSFSHRARPWLKQSLLLKLEPEKKMKSGKSGKSGYILRSVLLRAGVTRSMGLYSSVGCDPRPMGITRLYGSMGHGINNS